MSRAAALRFLSLGMAFQLMILAGLLVGYLTIGREFYIPAPFTFPIALVSSAALCGRGGYRLSGAPAIGWCGVVYVVFIPAFGGLDVFAQPQDFVVLSIVISLLGLIIAPLTSLGVVVVNHAALPLAKGRPR